MNFRHEPEPPLHFGAAQKVDAVDKRPIRLREGGRFLISFRRSQEGAG